MPTFRVDPLHPDPAVIARGAELLRAGQLVAFPTETVYGLGAHALDPAAVRRIYEAKGRPAHNPVIVHIADTSEVGRVCAEWPEAAAKAARAFWPGPLTLVLAKRPEVPDAITAGLATVAVRVPSHPVALALLRASGVPIAAPSANRYTEVSPTTARHVEKALGDRVPLIIDGGPTTVGIESTVVDLTGPRPRLLRPGVLDPVSLEAVLGPLEAATEPLRADEARPAPGMIERHYAPRARVILVDLSDEAAVEAARAAARAEEARGGHSVALVRSEVELGAARVTPMPTDAGDYARVLFAALHDADDAGCTLLIVEQVPEGGAWTGVRDRLQRAAAAA
jgi:L-threonylcarbamoyladenylate synthase